jgi:predicted nucleotidyltransferase
VPWLDERTAGLVRAIVAAVARDHPNLRAAILYGSVARHEERPLDDSEPSDVDLLLLFDVTPGTDRLSVGQRLAISESMGRALDRHPDARREVQVQFAVGNLAEWDVAFVESVARDGILLWARDPLPESLAGLTERSFDATSSLARE